MSDGSGGAGLSTTLRVSFLRVTLPPSWISTTTFSRRSRNRSNGTSTPARAVVWDRAAETAACPRKGRRSEEHTSELQSLMRISYAVFCLKTKTKLTIKKDKQITMNCNDSPNIHSKRTQLI